MRCALLLLVIGVSILSAEALQCYSCTGCSETFDNSQNSVRTGCNYCAKYKYKGTSTADRLCASSCTAGTDLVGNQVYCCSTDKCNSATQLRGFSWLLLLLPAAALAAVGSRI